MATENVQVTCDGASGTAAPFVVSVSANGQTVTQESVTGLPVSRTGGEWWSWSIGWQLKGRQVVTVQDATHDGAQTWDVVTVEIDCPVQEDLNSAPDNPSSEPETLITLPLPVLVVEPSVNPSVSPNTPVDTSPTTSVELSTVAPSSTDYSGQDDFYVATFVAEPVGCCADYVAEVGTAATLPATGPQHVLPMIGVGAVLVLVGIMCRKARRVAA